MLGDERRVVGVDDRELVPQALRILERRRRHVLAGDGAGLAGQALLPEVERRVGADAPADRVHHPGARSSATRSGILEERDVAPRGPLLVRVEEVVDGRIVLVDGLLDHPQTEDARVEVDVPRRVAGDAGDVVDTVEAHDRNLAVCSRPTREDRDRRPVLVVVLGGGCRARGARRRPRSRSWVTTFG